jgi:hypothetical protein
MVAFGQIALACQYTVRDIGFVDLRGAEYVLVVKAPTIFSQQQNGKLGDWSFLDDTNIGLLYDWTDAPTIAADQPLRCTVELVDSKGRRLTLGNFEVSGKTNERASDELSVSKQVFQRLFETPGMRALTERTLTSFSQIVLFESTDSAQNSLALLEVEKAAAAIKRIEPMLPRPLARPVEIVRIRPPSLADEPLLAWTFGIASDSRAQPVVGVVYGKSKLAGPVLRGEEIVTRELLGQLALIGESCECETDRSWNEELILPGYWPSQFRSNAASTLGFDPDSPLVQAEVARIVSRGPKENSNGEQGNRDGVDDIEQLLLGYDEQSLGGVNSAAELMEESRSGEHSERTIHDDSSAVSIAMESGDGWDFTEPNVPEKTLANPSAEPTKPLAERSSQSQPSQHDDPGPWEVADFLLGTKLVGIDNQARSTLMVMGVLGIMAACLLVLGFAFRKRLRS